MVLVVDLVAQSSQTPAVLMVAPIRLTRVLSVSSTGMRCVAELCGAHLLAAVARTRGCNALVTVNRQCCCGYAATADAAYCNGARRAYVAATRSNND